MKILFDLTAIYDHLTGIERYTINITKSIIKNHLNNQYFLLFKNEVHSEFKEEVKRSNVKYKIIPACHKLFFNQWRLMRALYAEKADRYIFMSFTSPWFFRTNGIINTIHDISAWDVPESRKKHMVLYGRIGIRNAIRVSRRIGTVSEFSKSRLVERLHVDATKIFVAYNGVAQHFLIAENNECERQEKVVKKYNLPEHYLLCLSTLEPRKNMMLLIQAFKELVEETNLQMDLVLAGRRGWKLDDVLGDEKSIAGRVHVTGFIDDADLPTVYQKADVFVFPSVYEGFGIPIIEAMSQGTVVISSDSSSLPEVVGGAGILFKNNSLIGLKKAILQYTKLNEKDIQEYRDKGYKRMKAFSWDNEAEKYYQNIIS